MIFPEAKRHFTALPIVLFGLCLALLSGGSARAQSDMAFQEYESGAWLLTYGPGEIYWQRFGHNAIWIRDPALGIDHTFNFGFFDFAAEGFLRNFVQGRLNYFAAARPARVEMAEYIDDDRSIRAQRLDLDHEQFVRLRDYLLEEVSPENREYLYDYYRHNCSTRIRDALDLALDGELRRHLENTPAHLDYRDHTRRLTEMDWLYYLGLQAGLGSPVDHAISRWEEAFIPGVLAEVIAVQTDSETGERLVTDDSRLYESNLDDPPVRAKAVWYRYQLIAAGLLIVAWLLCFIPYINAKRLSLTWLSIAGLLGLVLVFFWFFTDHWVARMNVNLLLLNPLWLVVALIPVLRKPGAWLVILTGLGAMFMPLLPPWQYTADVVALVLPLNLAASLMLLRSASQFGK